VSLPSISCKLLEHIIHGSVMDLFDEHRVLCDKQHGFRARGSCETQLSTLDRTAENRDQGCQTDIILLDICKAFDKVPHQRLQLKMEHCGVRGVLMLCWIQDFLRQNSISNPRQTYITCPRCSNVFSPESHRGLSSNLYRS
jgi:hypothetical protein